MILTVSDDKMTKIAKVNEILGINAADSDVYLRDGSIRKILDGLGSLKNSTKSQYLAVVSNVLSTNGCDNTMYCEARRALERTPTVTLNETCIERLVSLLSHKNSAIKILAGVIYYGVDNNVCFDDIVKTTLVETGNLPLLDFTKKTWRIRHDGIATQYVPISDEFIAHIKPLCGAVWLIEDQGKQKYSDIKNISRTFSTANNNVSFKELRMFYINFKRNEIVPEPAKPKKIGICLKSEAVVDPIAICSTMNICDASKKIYVMNAMNLQRDVLGIHTKLLIGKFCTPDTYAKVKDHLAECTPNVARNRATALCRILEASNISASYCSDYHKLVMECQSRADVMPRKQPRPFLEIVDEIKRVFDSHKTCVSLQVIMLVILNSIKHNEYDIGVLRLHDFIHTKLMYDEQYSYIDWEKQVWYIRKECTKNKVEREIQLSSEFIAQLRELYNGTNTKWMVFMERDGNNHHIAPTKYSATDSLTEMIERRIGCGITEIRASYVTHIHNGVFDNDKCIRMANNMGHRHITAMEDYVRDIYAQGEGD